MIDAIGIAAMLGAIILTLVAFEVIERMDDKRHDRLRAWWDAYYSAQASKRAGRDVSDLVASLQCSASSRYQLDALEELSKS